MVEQCRSGQYILIYSHRNTYPLSREAESFEGILYSALFINPPEGVDGECLEQSIYSVYSQIEVDTHYQGKQNHPRDYYIPDCPF